MDNREWKASEKDDAKGAQPGRGVGARSAGREQPIQQRGRKVGDQIENRGEKQRREQQAQESRGRKGLEAMQFRFFDLIAQMFARLGEVAIDLSGEREGPAFHDALA